MGNVTYDLEPSGRNDCIKTAAAQPDLLLRLPSTRLEWEWNGRMGHKSL